jgi:ribosomal protein S12
MLTTGEIKKILESGDVKAIAAIPKEELDIFEENQRQRSLYSKEGIKNLYSAICEKAVSDYKVLHKMTLFSNNPDNAMRKKCREEINLENFFGSDFFLNVSGLRSKEHAIETIEKTMIEERKRKLNLAMV